MTRLQPVILAALAALCLFAPIKVARGAEPATQPTPVSTAPGDLSSLSLEDLMNVDVSSVSKEVQPIADAPAAVTVISQEDIQRSGLREIPEILRLSPGLFVQQGNQFTGWSVSSRGFGTLFSNKLLVLDDGRTLYTPLFSGVYWNTVDYPLADLDRIEVIRGPGATLWGSNAVDGVINIISKDAKDTQGLLVDSSAGTAQSDLSVRYGGKIDDETYYRVYTKGSAHDDLGQAPNPVGDDNQWQDARTGFRVDHYSSDTDTLTLQGDGFNQSASDQLVTGHVLSDYTHDYRSGENMLGRWTHVFSDTSDLSMQAYYDRIDFRDGYSRFEGNTFDVDFQHRFELCGGNEIMYGLGGRLLANDVGGVTLSQPVVDPTDRNTYQLSSFVQDTITVVPDRVHFIAGTKLEQDSFTGFALQPSLRLLWTPSASTSLWGAVSRAVRTPSLLEWDEHADITVPNGPGQFAQLRKTTDHPESEKMIAYELGMRQQIAKPLSVDATVFADTYHDLIGLDGTGVTVDPAETPSTIINQIYNNAQKAQTYGTEIAADWQVAPNWKLSGSYSLLLANVQDIVAGATPNPAAVEQSYPQNQFQIHSYVDVTRHIQFNSGLYYVENVGSRDVLGPVGSAPGSYWRADLGITWKPNDNFECSVGVQNAFDPHHLESPYNGTASADVDRSVYAQATWKF